MNDDNGFRRLRTLYLAMIKIPKKRKKKSNMKVIDMLMKPNYLIMEHKTEVTFLCSTLLKKIKWSI